MCHFFPWYLLWHKLRVFLFPFFLIDLYLPSDPAQCFVVFLLSIHVLKPGTPNWAPCFNAEDLLVLGGLLFIYFEELFTRLHSSAVTLLFVVHIKLCKQSQSLRFCVGLYLVAYLNLLLVSVTWRGMFILLANGGMKSGMVTSVENSCHRWNKLVFAPW